MTVFTDNRKAHFNYEILEKYEAGIELLGFEVKSIKASRATILGAFTIIRGGEVYIVGMQVPPYQVGNTPLGYDPLRVRKLLLNKKEIKAYLKNDCVFLSEIVLKFIETYGTKISLASSALHFFKKLYHLKKKIY